jgi:hypothetical protein
MPCQFPVSVLCLAAVLGPYAPRAAAGDDAAQVPQAVRDLAGTYVGSWTTFGIDAMGQVVPRNRWTDTIKVENPTVKGGRAFVTTTDEMAFEGGRIHPMKVPGTEGYFLNKDGSLGDYYFEAFGQVTRMRPLGEGTWAAATPANPRELANLGFANVAAARHAVVKVVTTEAGTETHRITRVTTVNWKDRQGTDRWLQFVSLQGHHKRQTARGEDQKK